MKNLMIRRVVMTAFVGLLGAGSMFAQPEGRGEHHRGEVPRHRLESMEDAFAGLDLTDRQKAQIAQLQEEFRKENEDAMKEIAELRKKALEQMRAGDRDGAQATREEIGEKSRALGQNAQELREQIGMILTDEQKAQLAEQHREGRERREHGRPGDCPDRGEIFEKLNLTDEQKAEIRELREEYKEEHADEIERMKELGRQMREQARAGDREGAQATRDEMKELREALGESGEELRNRIGSILTGEQRAALKEHMERMKECREMHRDDRGEGKRRGEHGPAVEDEGAADIR